MFDKQYREEKVALYNSTSWKKEMAREPRR
jgi:hypothetical protein